MSGLADRFRPFREALLAIAEHSGERLRRLAPEIRQPTERIIAYFQPQGLGAPPAPRHSEPQARSLDAPPTKHVSPVSRKAARPPAQLKK